MWIRDEEKKIRKFSFIFPENYDGQILTRKKSEIGIVCQIIYPIFKIKLSPISHAQNEEEKIENIRERVEKKTLRDQHSWLTRCHAYTHTCWYKNKMRNQTRRDDGIV